MSTFWPAYIHSFKQTIFSGAAEKISEQSTKRKMSYVTICTHIKNNVIVINFYKMTQLQGMSYVAPHGGYKNTPNIVSLPSS